MGETLYSSSLLILHQKIKLNYFRVVDCLYPWEPKIIQTKEFNESIWVNFLVFTRPVVAPEVGGLL